MIDTEKLAVDWAKINVTESCATRLPQDFELFLRVVQINARHANEDGTIIAQLQWDAYATSPKTTPPYPAAISLAGDLIDEMRAAAGETITDTGFIYLFAGILGPQRIEEPETGWARYLIEAQMVCRPLT